MVVNKEKIIRRLKIARGHLQGIIFMIKRNEYCLKVSQQIHAVKGSLEKIDLLLLERFLKEGGDFSEALKIFNSKKRLCL